MPHYLPIVSLSYGLGTVAARPRLAAMIGNMTGDWVIGELFIRDACALLMGWDMPPSDFEPSLELHHAGIQVFDYLPALKQRMELIVRLSKSTLPPADHKRFVKEVVSAVERGSRARNRVAHSVWATSDTHPDELVRMPAQGEGELWGVEEFEAEASLVSAASDAFHGYFVRVHELRLAHQRARYPVAKTD